MTPYIAGQNAAFDALFSQEKKASFQQLFTALQGRMPVRTARVAGRSLEEFARNAEKYRTKAPQFAEQTRQTAEAMRRTFEQRNPGVPLFRGSKGPTPNLVGEHMPVKMAPGLTDLLSGQRGIELSGPNPAVAAHEAGHAVDFTYNRPTNMRGSYLRGGAGVGSTTREEFAASRHANQALGGPSAELAGLSGTYLQHGLSKMPTVGAVNTIPAANARQAYGKALFEHTPNAVSSNPFGLADRVTEIKGQMAQPLARLNETLAKERAASTSFGGRVKSFFSPKARARTQALQALPGQIVTPQQVTQAATVLPGVVSPDLSRLARRQGQIESALSRRAPVAREYEYARGDLENPFLNPRVGAQTPAQAEAIANAEYGLSRHIASGLGEESADLAQRLLATHRAAALRDPHFAERQYRQLVQRLNLGNDPAVREALSRFQAP